MAGRVALVTGGGGGIGEATARLFVEEGGAVALVDVDRRAAEKAAAEITASTHGAPAGSTIEAERTQNEVGRSTPGAGAPLSRSARAAVIKRLRTWMIAVSLVPRRSIERSTMPPGPPWLSCTAWKSRIRIAV